MTRRKPPTTASGAGPGRPERPHSPRGKPVSLQNHPPTGKRARDRGRIPEGRSVADTDALLNTGALQSAIFNSANFSSIATDAKGVIQIFNVGAERMLGYAAAEV